MKKSLLTLLVLSLVFCALLMSCKQDVNAPAADELVAVTFEEAGQSRGLTATLESFDVKDFYWTYTASKTVDPTTGVMLDGSGLKSGETSVEAYVQKGKRGLINETTSKPVQVPGFSQGLWDFTLYAYKNYDSTNGVSDLVFKGSVSGVLLQKNGLNKVSVVVSPIEDGTGIIHIGEITLKAVSSASQSLVSSTVSILNTDDTPASYTYDAVEKNFTIKAGTYKVKVVFSNVADSSTITYAEGYVIATVYSGLKTTIAGDLSELVTYAQFDAELNPDILNATVSSGSVEAVTTTNVTFTGADKVTATLPKTNAVSLVQKLATELGTDDPAHADANLSLTVNTTAADATSITYDISMSAAVTYSKGGTSTTTTTQVTNAEAPVKVVIDVQRGLTGIEVTHGSSYMTQVSSEAALIDQTFFYDDVNGKIYICTSTFSPFSLSYTVPEYVAEYNGQKFASLEAAFAAAEAAAEKVEGKSLSGVQKIKLLKNTTVSQTIAIQRNDYELDLNGCSISSTVRVFHMIGVTKQKSFEITGKGEISATVGGDSSVIRVGRDNDSQKSSLTIGKDVVINAGKDTYGITVFGTTNSYNVLPATKTVHISGKIYSDLSAISGTGNSGQGNTSIHIEDGAVLEAKSMSGIYHPQDGSLYVHAALISGTTGIEMKGGNTTVIDKDAKITATSSTVSHTVNNNGNSTIGYAVAVVENAKYPGNAQLSISAGTFRGPVAIVVDTAVPEDKKATITISGGKFTDDPSAYIADTRSVVYRDGMYEVLPGVCKIGETWYPSIKSAVAAAGNEETTIVLQGSAKGPGVKITDSDPKNIIIDLNGYTYTIGSPVGSTGTETQAWHLEKGSTITIKNGTLDVDPKTTPNNFKMLLQNYCDLTLDNVVLDGSGLNDPGAYTSSNNNGKVVYKNGTKIIGKDGCYAFDVCWGPNKGYPAGTQVSIDDSCEVVGKIEIGTWGETNPDVDVLSTLTVVSKKFDSQLVCGNKAYQISYDGNTRKLVKLVPASN